MLTIDRLSAEQAAGALDELAELLRDTVAGGASVGFLPPLAEDEARSYWQDVVAAVGAGSRILLAAREDARIIGSVQLDLPAKSNARHRAEVQKLMVYTQARGQGIGRRLMHAIEEVARQECRMLLVLDTRQGDAAERLYASHGYIRAGEIPWYAQSADGTLHTTVFFYRALEG